MKYSRRSVGLYEIREVAWSEVIESFICEKKNFEVNAKFDWKPMKLLKRRSNVL